MSTPTVPPPSKSQPSRRDAWERWTTIWHIVFYLSLGVPTLMVLRSGTMRYSVWVVVGLSIALGLWYGLIMVWLLPRAGEKWQVALSLLYLVGGLVMWFPLSRAHWAYYITASSFYGLMWGTLPFGLALGGVIVMTGLIVWSQALNVGKSVHITGEILVVSVAVIGWSVLLALWMRTVMRESAERKRLIEQLETAQNNLAAVERQAGMLQERQRLAQEIHDTLAQGFISIIMQLEAVDQVLPQASTTVRGHLLQALNTARSNLAEARRLVMALRPEPLEGASLPEALGRVAKKWSQETGTRAEFNVTGTPCTLHPEVEVTLLRAMQEALANIHKHAQAQQASITLSYMDDQVALDIHDDGIGFDPNDLAQPPLRAPDQAQGGFGLRAMRERVSQFGGEVIVESAAGQGTTLAIQIPMDGDIAWRLDHEQDTADHS
jgi:signal transduction histidine kinase